MKIEIEFVEKCLSTKPENLETLGLAVTTKAPDDEKATEEQEAAQAAADEVDEEQPPRYCIFHRKDDGELMLWDYQVKGFIKEAADILRQASSQVNEKTGKKSSGMWGTARKKVDNFVFVFPRKISLGKHEPDGIYTRTVIGQTPKGQRVSIARSEYVSPGTKFQVEISVLPGAPFSTDMLRMCLNYGVLKGIGQWRNAGWGRFTWKEIG